MLNHILVRRPYSRLTNEREILIQFAEKLISNIADQWRGHWCFFAGFAFLLNGVEKKTYDIDVLAKDKETYQHIGNIVRDMGMHSKNASEIFSSFLARSSGKGSSKELSLDLLLISDEWARHFSDMWTDLEFKQLGNFKFPVPKPIDLILLKIIVNANRKLGDEKKERDLVDVQQLMLKRRIVRQQIVEEATNRGLEDITLRFLGKLK